MIPAPKPPLRKAMEFMARTDVWARIGLCVLTTTILYVVMFGWDPPFSYRVRQAPLRDVHAHTSFLYDDFKATVEKRDRERRNFLCLYGNDQLPLEQLRQALIDDIFEIKQKEFADVEKTNVWSKFFPADANNNPQTAADEESFNLFREAIVADEKLAVLRKAVEKAFLQIDKTGLLETLTHKIGDGNMEEIYVFPKGNLDDRTRVKVSDVRIAEVTDDLRNRLIEEFRNASDTFTDPELVATRIFNWFKPQLPVTLSWDEKSSKEGAENAVLAVGVLKKTIKPGDQLEQQNSLNLDLRGIKAGVPLDAEDIRLLRAEHLAQIDSEGLGTKLIRSCMFFGLFAAVFSMVCQYLYYRDRDLLDDLRQFGILLGLMLLTLTIAWVVSMNVQWRSEIIPITIFSMTIAIAYHMELALMLGALVSLAFTVAHGFGLGEFVILTAASSSAALMCRTIRSRTKLVNVGLIVAAIVFPTAIGVQFMLGQPLGWALATDALWFGGGAGIAGLVMTALLPFLERLFDIQTDISLLELSDANHPLLKELVQRAPGTYNHSINVASMSEAAADAIGANGLLCRVGAYFHDIGKLRKPEYFIENQAGGPNKHDDLVPTMSTLVIIAHVKDGVEIARKHRLPQRIIDLIEQHHGTTLVEYFYRRAEAKQLEEQGETEHCQPLDEADYRYPGPKPQTPEAAAMMLADTVESASRVLREPAPARIENLVREIAKKKFDDGQFEECNITIQQLNTIQESLIKSLNAMYHARVKYPEQQSA
jgi:putative nucleotidyltransferase with HDIG domain